MQFSTSFRALIHGVKQLYEKCTSVQAWKTRKHFEMAKADVSWSLTDFQSVLCYVLRWMHAQLSVYTPYWITVSVCHSDRNRGTGGGRHWGIYGFLKHSHPLLRAERASVNMELIQIERWLSWHGGELGCFIITALKITPSQGSLSASLPTLFHLTYSLSFSLLLPSPHSYFPSLFLRHTLPGSSPGLQHRRRLAS